MPAIEPGEKFTIEYGNGRRLEVVALAGRKAGELARKIQEFMELETSGKGIEIIGRGVEMLELCVGKEKADELYDSHVDDELAMQIASATLGKQSLSEDEQKKSESLPS